MFRKFVLKINKFERVRDVLIFEKYFIFARCAGSQNITETM